MYYKLLQTILFFVLTLTLTVSCGSKSGTSNNDEPAENDSIQGVFFDTPFGSSREDVITNFLRHDMILLEQYSTKENLLFLSKKGRYFTFGGIIWQYCQVILENGHFSKIAFFNGHKDKTEALSQYKSLHSIVASKYKLNDITPSDSTIYALSKGYSNKMKRGISVLCHRYETVEEEIWIAERLSYYDDNYNESVSNEL